MSAQSFDFVALGSSPAGLGAAIVAHDRGLKAIVLEASDLLGGGTARSNGGLWIPLSTIQRELGFTDSCEDAIAYVEATSRGRHDPAKLAAFIDKGNEALTWFLDHTPLRILGGLNSDYYDSLPSARICRFLWPDTEGLTPLFAETGPYPDLAHIRPAASGKAVDGGTALIGALVAACNARGIPIVRNCRARHLHREGGRVTGVVTDDGRTFRAKKGVLIATGGYEFNADLVRAFVPYPDKVFAMTARSNRGDGHLMGMELGAAVAMMDCAIWMIGLKTPGEGNWGIAPPGEPLGGASFFALPGAIIVNAHGRRVANEGFYPGPPEALFPQTTDKRPGHANLPLFVLFNGDYLDRFGIGPVKPGTGTARTNAIPSWLQRGDTLAELAANAGIDAGALAETVAAYDRHAAEGHDPDFLRGADRANPIVRREREKTSPRVRYEDTSAYISGALAPLGDGPYFAAELGLATIGNRGGLVTDTAQRVLDWGGAAIPGLWAASNAAAQLAFGAGYTSGQSIAHSLVGGYIAGRSVADDG